MDKIDELLTRGVDSIYPTKEELEKALQSGKKLTLYQGFDPTGTQLHIGHMVGLRKLRQWQDAGHRVIFLIGDGTGQAGDPSGKKTAREKFFTQEELRTNALDYVKQAGKIVRFAGENPVEIKFNGDWLNKLGLVEILGIASHFSLQQMIERDLFQERIKQGVTLTLREFLYPLLQGYDSVAMDVDLEVGGNDQTFNMLCGRTLMKAMKNKDKFVMTTPLLTDSQGRKIGKTEGNVIALTDKPADLFGKMMTLPDDVIVKGFEYLTDIPMTEVADMKNQMESGENPVIFKKKLAYEVVKALNTEPEAQEAQIEFERVHGQKEKPADIKANVMDKATLEHATIADVLTTTGMVLSKAEAKRVVEQGGVSINDQKITDAIAPFAPLLINGEAIIQKGKNTFVKIQISK